LGVLKTALRKHVMEEGLDRVQPFGTVFACRVVPLAVTTTKMWEYTSPTDPDRVSPVVVSNEELWSWLDMVLKVGNQRVIGASEALDEENAPSFVSFSSLLPLIGPWASDRVLTLPCF
jgi:hypothetical protein